MVLIRTKEEAMTPIQVILTEKELEEVDRLVKEQYDSKSRADLVRKATLEYCLRHS